MKKILTLMAAFCCMTVVFSQTKIVTGHPDFNVKVTRCEASGKNVVLDLVFTNVSSQDVEAWGIAAPGYSVNFGGSSYRSKTAIYDSEGNIYDLNNNSNAITIKVGNSDYRGYYTDLKMISDVPMKVSVMITGVPTNVESLARVDLSVFIPSLKIEDTPIIIKNIPITR